MFSGLFLFLNIGSSEMIFIVFIALLLFGGKKLPELARGLGRGIRDFKDASESVKRDINEQINNFEKDLDLDAKEPRLDQQVALRDEPSDDDIARPDPHYHNYDYNDPDEAPVSPRDERTPNNTNEPSE